MRSAKDTFMVSAQMALIFKKGFQFLDSLRLCLKDEIMFLCWYSNKVRRSIIPRDSIQMMNVPSGRGKLPMCVFPNQDMFINIAIGFCTWMIFVAYQDITLFVFVLTASPSWILFTPSSPYLSSFPSGALFPSPMYMGKLVKTSSATGRFIPTRLSAINTWMPSFLKCFATIVPAHRNKYSIFQLRLQYGYENA